MRFPDHEKGDIQALVKTGFGRLKGGCYLLFRIVDADAARGWLRKLDIVPMSAIGPDKEVKRAIQVAFTAAGLRALKHSENLVRSFAPEFSESLATDSSRSRRLGDIGANDPVRWTWGVGEREPHVLLMLFTEKAEIGAWTADVKAEAHASGLSLLEALPTSDMKGHEPFGFADGISQPEVDWDGTRQPGSAADMDYGNLVATGEFLLGYRNEYGLYTERPLLDESVSGAVGLPTAEDEPRRYDLGRNGSYLVFRQLDQDVRGFWRWMHREAGDSGALDLAERMVGRQRLGDPLPGLGTADIAGMPDTDRAKNGFDYRRDSQGQICPIGAHIRRSNPRTGDYPTGRTGFIRKLLTLLGLTGAPETDRIASTRFHRILRRGREFGAWLEPEKAVEPDAPDPRSGLHFICLNANLARQFEFVQGAWLASAKFAGMSNEQDPMLGNREPFPGTQPNDRFTRPQAEGACLVTKSIPQFVTVRGGAYFFLPGLRALRWLLADR